MAIVTVSAEIGFLDAGTVRTRGDKWTMDNTSELFLEYKAAGRITDTWIPINADGTLGTPYAVT